MRTDEKTQKEKNRSDGPRPARSRMLVRGVLSPANGRGIGIAGGSPMYRFLRTDASPRSRPRWA
jgi:hypothetical protein